LDFFGGENPELSGIPGDVDLHDWE